jgi:hypothetical protein
MTKVRADGEGSVFESGGYFVAAVSYRDRRPVNESSGGSRSAPAGRPVTR